MEDDFWKTVIRRQFGAAIDMLDNAMSACPDDLWCDRYQPPEWNDRDVVGFWYVAYHTLFFLDYYLSDSLERFAPPPPFTLDELDPAGILPERPYTKPELQTYLEHCRAKLSAALESLTGQQALARRRFGSLEGSLVESLLYQMRHVQHHAAQLNLLLRQGAGTAPRYVQRARDPQ